MAEYSNYSNVFSAKNTVELLKNSKMNEHAIELEKDKQLSFRLIYSLAQVELEILKIYIKTNLANKFIWSSKYLTEALIFFDQKPNKSLCFCIDYQNFNNITIKN